jgi:biopolymer transport protein ExbD
MAPERIRVKRDDEPGIEFNNTSMTDVIFILLIFFISLSQVRTSSLSLKLPSVSSRAAQAQDEPAKPLVVEVTNAGAIYVDGERVDAKGLTARVAARRCAAPGEEPRVRIRGDTAANYGTTMQVVAALAEAGITRVEFAVKAEGK